MFKKLHRQIERKRDGRVPLKFRFDVQVEEVSHLPSAVDKCRVVWARGPKVQMTRTEAPREGCVRYNQVLSQVATIYRANNHFESKEYSFSIQAPSKTRGTVKMITLGKATVNLSEYASLESLAYKIELPIEFDMGDQQTTVKVSLGISGHLLKGLTAGDAMTEVSCLSGFTSMADPTEQDLQGFYADGSSNDSRERAAAIRSESGVSLPDTIAEESESEDVPEEVDIVRPVAKAFARVKGQAEKTRIATVPAAMATHHHEEIEEMKRLHQAESKIWLAEKSSLLDARLALEEELTRTQCTCDRLRKEAESLNSKIDSMQKDAEKTKQKHAKEVSTIKKMSMDALQEADSKIQDIERNLEKEREDHRELVKVLEEDALQASMVKHAQHEDEKRKLEESITIVTSKNADLKEAIQKLQSEVEQMHACLRTAEMRCEEAETAHVSLQIKMDVENQASMEEKLAHTQAEVRKLEMELMTALASGKSLDKLENELKDTQAAEAQAQRIITQLKAQIFNAEEEKRNWMVQWDAQVELVSRVPELEALVDSLQKANHGLERSISRKKKDIESLQIEINSLKLKLQSSEDHTHMGPEVTSFIKPDSQAEAAELLTKLATAQNRVHDLTLSRDSLIQENAILTQKLEKEASQCREAREILDKSNVSLSELKSQLADRAMKLVYAEKSLVELRKEMEELKYPSAATGGQRADESDQIMLELVQAKVTMAELQEGNIKTRRELYKSKECNMKLASKMTKLEALLYSKGTAIRP